MSADANQPKRYGVLIASSRFPDEPKLSDLACPENDVDGLQQVLSDEAIGGFSELLVVKNEPSHAALRKVHQVLRKAGRDDFVLIYYAGHGKTDLAGKLHLATTETVSDELETTSIPAQRIRSLIDNARTTKVALILDCCYSGAIEKTFLRGDVEDQLNLMAGGRGTFIMTAATDVQTAREEIRDGFGIFTKHLIDGIRGAADVDGDGIVTMNELYDYVHREVIAESHQVPMKWNLNVQGEMVIAQSSHKPREARRAAVRARLFAMADQGVLPDMVFTKALETSNLSFQETRQGAAARYDALLDRVLDPNLRIGDFLTAWLQVQPDDAPGPAAKPEPKSEPDTAPKPEPEPEPEPNKQTSSWTGLGSGFKDGLESGLGMASGFAARVKPRSEATKKDGQKPESLWPAAARAEGKPADDPSASDQAGQPSRGTRTATAAAKPVTGSSVKWSDVGACVAWVFAGMILIPASFETLSILAVIIVMLGWPAAGWVLMKRAGARLNPVIKGVYWVCIGGSVALLLALLSEF